MGAQLSWESICLTSRGSQVRALLFPPFFWPGSSVGQNASLSRQRSWVRAPFGSPECASVAQSVEQGTENPRVVGSIPTGGTKKISGFSSSGRAPPCQGGGSEFEPRNPLHFYMAPQPSGKAEVCKTFIHQFKSGWRLHKRSQSFLGPFSFVWIEIICSMNYN